MAEVTKKRSLNSSKTPDSTKTSCTLDRFFTKKPKIEVKSERTANKDSESSLLNEDELKRGILLEKKWTEIRGENLNVDHKMMYSSVEANSLLARCEQELTYFDGDLAKVQIFGKWMNIPRKQVY